MVPTGIKYMYSLMLLYICVSLYMHVSQYSPVYTLHMFCACYVISTLQGLLTFFLVGKLKLYFMHFLSFSFLP